MGSFDRDSKFKSNAGFSSVLFGRQKPITELELNETQLIQNNQMRRIVANIVGDGVNDLSAITYKNSVLTVGDCFFSCSGFLIKNTGLSINLADGETAYLQVWEETVTYLDTLKEEGNQQSSVVVDNTILDEDIGGETTRRGVVKYTISKTADSTKSNLAVAKISGGSMTILVDEVSLVKVFNTLSAHIANTSNPHNVTKAQVGLSNVNNTSDTNKPVSTAQQTAINNAKSEAKSYTDEKIAGLINGAPSTLDTLKEISDAMAENEDVVEALEEAVGTKAKASDLTAHTGNTSNPHNVTKAQVGLSNVPNVTTNNQTPTFTEASSTSALKSGETMSVLFGKIAKAITRLISHLADTSNPHSVTKSQIGLGSVDNTADSAKPVSTAQKTAIDAVQTNLNTHTSSTSNPHGVTKSQVGLGNVPNVATNDQTPTYSDTTTSATLVSGEKLSVAFPKIKLAITNLINHLANKSNPHGVTASQVGLGNVNNTADSAKPVSTAQATAIADAKSAGTTAQTNLNTHIADTGNPHSVTKSQVGLGNVPNVTTNDQTPTYTTASANANLTSGEKLSVAFGKIAKAISSLISHLANTSNPHSVTKAQVGLGNVDNTADSAKSVKYATSAGSANAVAWGSVTGKPSSYTPSAHNHANLISSAGAYGVVMQDDGNLVVLQMSDGTPIFDTMSTKTLLNTPTPSTASFKKMQAGTTALTSGSSALTTGTVYVQYE